MNKKIALLMSFSCFVSCTGVRDYIEKFAFFGSEEPTVPTAVDGNYFPDSIDQTFQKTSSFQREKRSLSQAHKGLQVIEVKRLTKDDKRNNEANLNWSADGLYMGFEVSDRKEKNVFVRSLDGTYHHSVMQEKKKSNFGKKAYENYSAGIRWSKKSQRYIFLSNGGVGSFQLYLGGVGQEDRKISSGKSKDGHAVWAPHSNELLFVSSRSGNGDLYLLNLDTERVTQLTDSPDTEYYPEWSADGSLIVFTSRSSGKFKVKALVRNFEGAWVPYSLLNKIDEVAAYRPVISPDRKKLAYYALNADKTYSLKLVSLTETMTNSVEFVSNNVVLDLSTGPSFSPDGRFLFYVENDLSRLNPIMSYSFAARKSFLVDTKTKMNRDVMVSNLGVLSFRAQVGAWDRVFIALTNTGKQFLSAKQNSSKRKKEKFL